MFRVYTQHSHAHLTKMNKSIKHIYKPYKANAKEIKKIKYRKEVMDTCDAHNALKHIASCCFGFNPLLFCWSLRKKCPLNEK